MANRGRYPRITWGTGFANTLEFGVPLDGALTYDQPREGSEWQAAPSGAADAWIIGRDYVLEGTVRWIPAADTTTPVVATGWNGPTGWAAFLAWAQQLNTFRFIPDRAAPGTYWPMHLLEPRGRPDQGLERGGRYRALRLVLKHTVDAEIGGY
jgi:hypothetical protein